MFVFVMFVTCLSIFMFFCASTMQAFVQAAVVVMGIVSKECAFVAGVGLGPTVQKVIQLFNCCLYLMCGFDHICFIFPGNKIAANQSLK